jgi:Spherulation-specific family 4
MSSQFVPESSPADPLWIRWNQGRSAISAMAGPGCEMIPRVHLRDGWYTGVLSGGDAGMSSGLRNGWRRRLAPAAGLAMLAVLAAVLVPAAADGATGAAARVPVADAAAAPATCHRTFVPAYPWSSSFWTQAINSKPAPGVMILNVTGMGAGATPVPHFQALVRKAHAKGIAVLGYSSTEYGQRPAAQVEADARDYKAWYKVNGMFLDLTDNTRGELSYYRTLATYIRAVNPGSVIWLNVGAYPAPGYMSVGNVIVAFEGSYASFRGLQVPAWAAHYRAARFADVVYATPGADLASAVRLSRLSRAKYLFATNLPGSPDPYSALPSYWSREVAAVAAGC